MLNKRLLYISQSGSDKPNLMLDGFSAIHYLEIHKIFKNKSSYDYYKNPQPLIYRFFNKIGLPADSFYLNIKILISHFKFNYDYMFFVKATEIYPLILRVIRTRSPTTKIIFWSNDDMYVKHNRTFLYIHCLKYVDLVVTSKSYNLNELNLLGARNILFQDNSYSHIQHNAEKSIDNFNFSHDVIFIGTFELERAKSIYFLALNGIVVHVYGSIWKKLPPEFSHKNMILHYENLNGNLYSDAIKSSKISLCFLRKINRDLQTTRSIEIPALKGFMLAERTDEHLRLFKEDEEAAYFSSNEELLAKVKFYLLNSRLRKKIASAGHARCLKGKYASFYRCKEIINYF